MFIGGMYTASGETRHLTIVALIALVPALAAVLDLDLKVDKHLYSNVYQNEASPMLTV